MRTKQNFSPQPEPRIIRKSRKTPAPGPTPQLIRATAPTGSGSTTAGAGTYVHVYTYTKSTVTPGPASLTSTTASTSGPNSSLIGVPLQQSRQQEPLTTPTGSSASQQPPQNAPSAQNPGPRPQPIILLQHPNPHPQLQQHLRFGTKETQTPLAMGKRSYRKRGGPKVSHQFQQTDPPKATATPILHQLQSQVYDLDSKVSEVLEDLELISRFIWSKFGGMNGFPEKVSAKYSFQNQSNGELDTETQTQQETKFEADQDIYDTDAIIDELSDPLAFSPYSGVDGDNETEPVHLTVPAPIPAPITAPIPAPVSPSIILAMKQLIQQRLQLIKPCSVGLINVTTFGIQSTSSNSSDSEPQIIRMDKHNLASEISNTFNISSDSELQETASTSSCSSSNLKLAKIEILPQEQEPCTSSSSCQQLDQQQSQIQIMNPPPTTVVENPLRKTAQNQVRSYNKAAKGTYRTERIYKCTLCPKSFTHKYYYDRHLRTNKHTGEKPFICEFCGASFSQRHNLTTHRYKHTGEKPFSCELCNAKFSRPKLVLAHKAKEHPGQRPYICQFCNKDFVDINERNSCRAAHVASGDPRPYICEFCGKTFPECGSKNKHRKRHTGDQPLECKDCGKRFSYPMQLKRHLLVHYPEVKPYNCDICGKPFGLPQGLVSHKKSHIGIWESSNECTLCGKRFKHESSLSLHMQRHKGIRPYPCKICGKRFVNAFQRNIHEKAHLGEYQCKLCGAFCSNAHALRSHTRSKHPDPEKAKETAELKKQEIKCEKCGRILKTIGGFKLHQKGNFCIPPRIRMDIDLLADAEAETECSSRAISADEDESNSISIGEDTNLSLNELQANSNEDQSNLILIGDGDETNSNSTEFKVDSNEDQSNSSSNGNEANSTSIRFQANPNSNVPFLKWATKKLIFR